MKPKTILVFGLPGAGKTYFASKLAATLGIVHINNDAVRNHYNDWDFSEEGRLRQAKRMRQFADEYMRHNQSVVLDFVCPKQKYRDIIKADIEVYANRTPVRDFPDTTAMFEEPDYGCYIIYDSTDVKSMIRQIVSDLQEFDNTAPTALMIGRFQPFHAGHKALFEKALEKHGQVCIAVRDMPSDEKNPFDFFEVEERIKKALKKYKDKFCVIQIPNVVDVVYGRDVGWTVSKIDLPEEIEAISATKIREAMRGD